MTQTRNGEVSIMHTPWWCRFFIMCMFIFLLLCFLNARHSKIVFSFLARLIYFLWCIHFSLLYTQRTMHGLHDILSVSAARTQELLVRRKSSTLARKNNEAGGCERAKRKKENSCCTQSIFIWRWSPGGRITNKAPTLRSVYIIYTERERAKWRRLARFWFMRDE